MKDHKITAKYKCLKSHRKRTKVIELIHGDGTSVLLKGELKSLLCHPFIQTQGKTGSMAHLVFIYVRLILSDFHIHRSNQQQHQMTFKNDSN